MIIFSYCVYTTPNHQKQQGTACPAINILHSIDYCQKIGGHDIMKNRKKTHIP